MISSVEGFTIPTTTNSPADQRKLKNGSWDKPDPDNCIHEWKDYVGFNVEKFEYCTKCDKKKK